MSAKQKSPVSNSGQPALKIGSRVRCTDDGVEGRITWANGVSVKVKWDDGEQVTWRRDSLADRAVEILDPASEEGQAATIPEQADVGQSDSAEELAIERPPVPSALEEAATGKERPAADTAVPAVEPARVDLVPTTPELDEGLAAPATPDGTTEMTVPSKRRRRAPAAPKEKKLSALNAAAKVLGEAGQAMNCQQMIEAMAEKGYWKSPGGKTPSATLYSAMLREITTKGAASRFVKTERGKFAHTGTT